MVTGDHKGTATNIAKQVHLPMNGGEEEEVKSINGEELEEKKENTKEVSQATVFARVTPAQKLDIINDFQKEGLIVGMTGDGVNDAPALKKAEIGIAMGQRGTQVAKEVADMILKDDAFSSIVIAIREGRIIFGNIRQFVVYQLSYHFAEILAIAAVMAGTLTLPLLPLQLLFLNILLDVFPALALGIGRGRENVMKEPPKDPQEPILTKGGWLKIVVYAIIMAGFSLGGYFYAESQWDMDFEQMNNILFFSLAFSQLLNVFNMRMHDENIVKNQVTVNSWVWIAIVFCAAVLLAAYWIPGLNEILSLQPIELKAWGLVGICSFGSLLAIQVFKEMSKK